jgi:hypothetical protein
MGGSSDSPLTVVYPHLLAPLCSVWISTLSFCSMPFTQTFYGKVSLELLRAGVQGHHVLMLSSAEKLALGMISPKDATRIS